MFHFAAILIVGPIRANTDSTATRLPIISNWEIASLDGSAVGITVINTQPVGASTTVGI